MSKAVFLLLLGVFVSGFVYLFLEIQALKNDKLQVISANPPAIQTNTSESVDYTNLVKLEVAKQISELPEATPTVVTKTVSTPQASSKTTQTTYIPISGPISTTSTDWYDAPGTQILCFRPPNTVRT